MVFTIRKKTEESQKKLNVQEVYALWDLLKTKYFSIESLAIFTNFAHDLEFKKLLEKRIAKTRNEIITLEDMLRQYRIHAPHPYRQDASSSINTEVLSDQYISSTLLFFEQELVEMVLNSFRSASTNDNVRTFFKELVFEEIDWLDVFIKYFKLKGWIDEPALYPNLPASANEQINCGEVYALWDHLTFRYNSIEISEIYYVLAKDGDFKVLLKKGIQDILRKESIKLEDEIKQFGIPLPIQPKILYDNLGVIEISDDTMFQQIYIGMQSAAILHAKALKQSTTNDRIRTLFSDLLISEVNALDKLIKYGKLKGWVEQTPNYTATQ